MTRLLRQRRTVSGCIAAAVFAVLALTLTSSPALSAGDPVDEAHYTFTSGTSVALDWRGTANDVRWGSTAAYGSSATGTAPQWTPWSSSGPFWQLELTGLAPGSVYHYSIGGGPDWTFHTPPTGDFRFDAIGDIGSTTAFSKLGNTLDQIANDDPSFVLMIGDLTYANATNATQAVVDQHFNDVMRWSTSAAYMPAWGNHEYDVAGADDLRNYKGRLLMPHAAASPGSPDISCCGDDWGWFDAGAARFIAYPEPWTGALADWQSKAATLMQQAQNDPSIKYIVTYGHRPAYSTGYHPGEPKLAGILDTFGASYSKYVLNLVGHAHDYERFQPINGVTHVTIGTPSSAQGPWSSTDPRTAFRALHLAHLRVDVSSTGLRLQAICGLPASSDDITCDNGSVIDEYTIGVPPVVPTATDFYVDKTMSTCSDTGQGTAAAPYCTIAKGLTRMAPGTTLFVGNGTYAETVKFTGSGTATKPITVTGWPGRDPVVGLGMTNGVYISGRSYIRISNLRVDHSTADGIYLSKSDHLTVTGNTVTHAGLPQNGQLGSGFYVKTVTDSLISANTADHNTDTGIYLALGTTRTTISYNQVGFNAAVYTRRTPGIWVTSSGNTVLGNVTHDNEDSGIYFSSNSADNLATLNVTYNNGDHGIDNLNVTNNRLIGNTVYRNCTSGINVEGTSSGVVVKNNVAVDNAVYPAYDGTSCTRRAGNIGVYDSATSSTVVDHNLVWLTRPGAMYVYGASYTSLAALKAARPTMEVHGVQGDPRFANAATWDLQLLQGSAAIDRADSGASGEQSTDVNGHDRVRDPTADNSLAEGPRRYDDLGAYEYQPDQGQASAPTAALSASPTSGTAPLTVTADASGSSDPQGETLAYTFDFGDGSAPVGPQSSPTTTHTYAQAGVRTLTVTVSNLSGLSSTATRTITITGTATAPTARLTVTPTSGTAPLAVSADASASTDPQGQALTYTFDFGDGSAVVGPQASALANHTFTSAGSYDVKATATNESGLSSVATRTVTVSAAPTAPTARLTVTPTSGTAPLAVSADASASTDPQGQALTYAFDFGDGSAVVGPQASALANHTFTTAGSYDVKATATNESGLSSVATQTVTVSAAPTAPTARLTITPTSGTAPLAVSADASASTDPQGQALTYTFDFGDGSAVVGPQASALANHTYQPGSYTVTVTVQNTSGLSSTATRNVTVSAAPAAPTARLAVTPTSGTAPLAVSADASASTDPQGQALTYTFDFGDGSAAVGPQVSALANHTYQPGSYTVTVTVRNTSGLSSTATRNVTVSPAPAGQPKYVEQIATNYSTTANRTSGYVTVWRTGGVPVGEAAVVTLQLTGSAGTGPVAASDARGNSYTVASDVADGQGGRLVVLQSRIATALDINDKITATFPSAAGYRMIADRLHDASHVDVAASASGSTTAFSSGTVQTGSGPEIVFGVVALTSGSTAPGWDAGWTPLAPYAVGSSYVGRAWRLSSSPASVSASGSATGRWLASAVGFTP